MSWAIRDIGDMDGPETWEPTQKIAISIVTNDKLFNLIGPQKGYPKVVVSAQDTYPRIIRKEEKTVR